MHLPKAGKSKEHGSLFRVSFWGKGEGALGGSYLSYSTAYYSAQSRPRPRKGACQRCCFVRNRKPLLGWQWPTVQEKAGARQAALFSFFKNQKKNRKKKKKKKKKRNPPACSHHATTPSLSRTLLRKLLLSLRAYLAGSCVMETASAWQNAAFCFAACFVLSYCFRQPLDNRRALNLSQRALTTNNNN